MANVLSIGLFDKDTCKQEMTQEKVVEIISKYMDATIQQTMGIYTHNDGRKIIEPSLQVVNYDLTIEECRKICVKLCKELNQETIILSQQEIQAEFISA